MAPCSVETTALKCTQIVGDIAAASSRYDMLSAHIGRKVPSVVECDSMHALWALSRKSVEVDSHGPSQVRNIRRGNY